MIVIKTHRYKNEYIDRRFMIYLFVSIGEHYRRYAWYFGKWFINFQNYSMFGKDYDPKGHSEAECRNDHPILRKTPVGFEGFHHEDYNQ